MPSTLVHGAIVVEGLGKTNADGTEALRDVSLRVAPGECYGLLGASGAGKSTLAGILGTLLHPTTGRATVAGADVVAAPADVRQLCGFGLRLDPDARVTAGELLLLEGRRHEQSDAKSAIRGRLLLTLLGVERFGGLRLDRLSDGARRRVGLAAALIHLPTVVVLDEPTVGLDPRASRGVWDGLERLRRRLGLTVLLTTQSVDEADRLCDRLGLIEGGRVVPMTTTKSLEDAA